MAELTDKQIIAALRKENADLKVMLEEYVNKSVISEMLTNYNPAWRNDERITAKAKDEGKKAWKKLKSEKLTSKI